MKRKKVLPQQHRTTHGSLISNFSPKKSLGQNFLVNQNICARMIESCDLKPEDTVLEIGPGKGVMTEMLSHHVKKVIAIEADYVLAEQLQKDFDHTNVEIIQADILQYDFNELPEDIKIVSNLPYNIATPIIEKVIEFKKRFSHFYMTVQLEYGQRLVSPRHVKTYGSFSCFVQYHAQPKMLFHIPSNAFKPQPKVQSCFLHLTIPETPKFQADNEKILFQITKTAFTHRRKTLANALVSIQPKDEWNKLLKSLNHSENVRAENLSVEDYVLLANAYVQTLSN